MITGMFKSIRKWHGCLLELKENKDGWIAPFPNYVRRLWLSPTCVERHKACGVRASLRSCGPIGNIFGRAPGSPPRSIDSQRNFKLPNSENNQNVYITFGK